MHAMCITISLAILLTSLPVLAGSLYSEPLGEPKQYQSVVASWQFVGVRFQFDQPSQIASIHTELGNTSSSWSLFAALIRLPTVTSLPQGNPFASGEVLHSEVFSLAGGNLQPVNLPFSLTVAPGAYAIVLGEEQFGSPASHTGMVGSYESTPGSTGFVWISPDFFQGPLDPWHDVNTLGGTFNFIVEGVAVPEPSSFGLFCMGTLALLRLPRKSGYAARARLTRNPTHAEPVCCCSRFD
jgi:hypothetical protein